MHSSQVSSGEADELVVQELRAKEKRVSPLIFDRTSFAKYVTGELGSCARKKELAIFKWEEERVRLAARAREMEEERQERERMREERRQQGDVDELYWDDYTDSDDEFE